MPKVGGKHFSYTPEGKAAARTLAKNTGKKVEYDYGQGKGNELSGGKPAVGRKTSSQRRNYA
tara:strand:- start:1065 stop:1250 length:186 start_codon:yes stop_codon:yes gene_type:complete